jgi:hypothetical protein
MATYRAAYYVAPTGEGTVLTSPEHASMPDAELTALAWACAQDAGIVDMHEDDPRAAYPRLTRGMLESGLRIGEWKD